MKAIDLLDHYPFNVMNDQEVPLYPQQLARERDQLRFLLEVNNAVVATLDLRELLGVIATALRRIMPHECASISLYDPDTQRLQIHALDFPASQGLLQEGLSVPVEGSPAGLALTSRQPVRLTRRDVEQFRSEFAQRILAE